MWVHGDWAYVDADGFWYIQGRSDDTLKIAGKRVGPAEVESVLVGHPAVAEAAAIGVPHEVKGESRRLLRGAAPGPRAVRAAPRRADRRVAQAMGKALKPERVLFARELPKTRSAKIMRRVIRATYLGKPAGDLSSLENPDAVKAIGEAGSNQRPSESKCGHCPCEPGCLVHRSAACSLRREVRRGSHVPERPLAVPNLLENFWFEIREAPAREVG